MGKDGALIAWTATTILTLLSIFSVTQIFYAHPDPVWGVFAVTGCFLASAILVVPPMWRHSTAYGRYIRIAAVLVLTGVGLFFPVKTTVTVSLPSHAHAN
ncbi:MAG TPA: hypothetical protein VHZ78_09160 [Rhizomicrobium sp.]|jgi:hypothetical protein|nr:hypothetical protein [Rhizomicrobium sp.]